MGSTDLSHINVNLLIALDLLLQELSVSGAAARAGVTPSAMSHSLRALREMFDDPLLVRASGGMVPSTFAQGLTGPLHAAVAELANVIRADAVFEPKTATRAFIVCAPDFIATLIAAPLAALLAEEAPRVDVEFRPLARMGDAMMLRQAAQLEEGSIDLVVGALLPQMPGIVREELYQERFVCLVRKDHPDVGDTLSIEQYAGLPQLLITITDDRSPGTVDDALAELGLSRTIRMRTRYFLMAPHIVAATDLLLTCPFQLAQFSARQLPVRILDPPLDLFRYSEYQAWHRRFDADHGLRWFRRAMRRAVARAISEAA